MGASIAPRTAARRRVGYLLAVAGVPLLGVSLIPFHPAFSVGAVLLVMSAAVVGIAWVGGTRPAVLAIGTALVVADVGWTEPRASFRVLHPGDVVALVVFLVTTAATIMFVERLQRAAAEVARADADAALLARANELRGAILDAVSHDLRTPLAAIKAAASSLGDPASELPPGDQAEMVATIDRQAERLDRLVTNLLDMSRVHAGAVRPLVRPTPLATVLAGALDSVDRADGRVVVDEGVDDLVVDTDGALLERAFANVITNALTWALPTSPIQVAAAPIPGSAVEVRISDDGPGIPCADRDLIFQPFQRRGDRGGPQGVGLGLAVARGLTEALGGRLQVEESTIGATFLFRLPAP